MLSLLGGCGAFEMHGFSRVHNSWTGFLRVRGSKRFYAWLKYRLAIVSVPYHIPPQRVHTSPGRFDAVASITPRHPLEELRDTINLIVTTAVRKRHEFV